MANKECEKIIRQIPLYIDDMLSDREKDEVVSHIAKCPDCKDEYDYLKAIMKNTAELPQKALPLDFHENLMERIKKEKKIPRRVLLHRASAYAAAAAVIALSFVAFGQFDDSQKSEIKEQYITSKVSEAPVNKEAIKKEPIRAEKKQIQTQKEQNDQPPTEEQIPAAISFEEEMTTYKTVTVALTDDIRDKATEILSAYEKDETGYKVEDIESVTEKLKELGAIVKTYSDNTNAHNYIVIK